MFEISLNYVPWGIIERKASIGLDNGLGRTGNKPLSEPMMA